MEIVTNNGVVVDTITDIKNGEKINMKLDFSEGHKFYYLRIKLNDVIKIWTAPFYYEKSVILDGGIDTDYDASFPIDGQSSDLNSENNSDDSGCNCSVLR